MSNLRIMPMTPTLFEKVHDREALQVVFHKQCLEPFERVVGLQPPRRRGSGLGSTAWAGYIRDDCG
jgi:hypothetical protein